MGDSRGKIADDIACEMSISNGKKRWKEPLRLLGKEIMLIKSYNL
jgi:hypothetical protein